MTSVVRFVGIAAFVWLAYFTGTKLVKMAQIRGFISGPAPESNVVTAMASEPGVYAHTFWLAWNGADVRVPGRQRINLSEDVWKTYKVGDRIEIFHFRGDPLPYHRKDIFADNGNFVFDGVLLSVWLIGIATLSVFQVRHYRRKIPPPLPAGLSR